MISVNETVYACSSFFQIFSHIVLIRFIVVSTHLRVLGTGCTLPVKRLLMLRWVVGSIPPSGPIEPVHVLTSPM